MGFMDDLNACDFQIFVNVQPKSLHIFYEIDVNRSFILLDKFITFLYRVCNEIQWHVHILLTNIKTVLKI